MTSSDDAPRNIAERRLAAASADRPPGPPRGVIDRFRETTKWAHIVSITGITWAGLMFAAGLVVLILGVAKPGGFPLALGGAVLAIIGVVYALPAVALLRYAGAMGAAVEQPSILAVERALTRHKTFWTIAGVIGLIMTLIQLISLTVNSAMPNFRDAKARARHKRAVTDVESIGAALERHLLDHHAYPNAKNVKALRKHLEPKYIETLPTTDPWGTEFKYQVACYGGLCPSATVMTLGADGKIGGPSITALEVEAEGNPDRSDVLAAEEARDVVWTNGRLTQPERTGAR